MWNPIAMLFQTSRALIFGLGLLACSLVLLASDSSSDLDECPVEAVSRVELLR